MFWRFVKTLTICWFQNLGMDYSKMEEDGLKGRLCETQVVLTHLTPKHLVELSLQGRLVVNPLKGVISVTSKV